MFVVTKNTSHFFFGKLMEINFMSTKKTYKQKYFGPVHEAFSLHYIFDFKISYIQWHLLLALEAHAAEE